MDLWTAVIVVHSTVCVSVFFYCVRALCVILDIICSPQLLSDRIRHTITSYLIQKSKKPNNQSYEEYNQLRLHLWMKHEDKNANEMCFGMHRPRA